jgi:hypothetical protein
MPFETSYFDQRSISRMVCGKAYKIFPRTEESMYSKTRSVSSSLPSIGLVERTASLMFSVVFVIVFAAVVVGEQSVR